MLRKLVRLLPLALAFLTIQACIPPFFTPVSNVNGGVGPIFLTPGSTGFLNPFGFGGLGAPTFTTGITGTGTTGIGTTGVGTTGIGTTGVGVPTPGVTGGGLLPGFGGGFTGLNQNGTFNFNMSGAFNFNTGGITGPTTGGTNDNVGP